MTQEATTLHDWLSLVVDALTPIAVVLVGMLAKRYADRQERRRDMAALRTQWRLEIARELLEELNVLYQFFTYVGDWRDIHLDRATLAKRNCDRLIATNSFLWSEKFLAEWECLKAAAFVENAGPGRDFLFRANFDRHRENVGFTKEWEIRFVLPSERIRREAFRPLCNRVMRQAAEDIGIVP